MHVLRNYPSEQLKMRAIDAESANTLLEQVSMSLDSWNRVVHKHDLNSDTVRHRPSRNADYLWCFAYWAAGWIPKGTWTLVQLDSSTSLSREDAAFCNSVAGNGALDAGFGTESSFVLEVDAIGESPNESVRIAHLIFAFLLLEAHVSFVSSQSARGQVLVIGDGDVLFVGSSEAIADARKIIEESGRSPNLYPDWLSQA